MPNIAKRRFFGFLSGLVIAAFGVACIVKSSLGISPVTSSAYVVSLVLPISFGTCVGLELLIFLILQKVILGKNFEKKRLLQLPTAFLFGWLCDVFLWLLTDVSPDLYIVRLAILLAGIFVLATGICCQLAANIMVGSQEGFMIALASRIKSRYSIVKVCVDVGFVLFSVLFSLFFIGKVEGIREGTVICMIGVGTLVGYLMPYVSHSLSTLGIDGRSGSQDESALR